jgi:hypothetical protein
MKTYNQRIEELMELKRILEEKHFSTSIKTTYNGPI